MTLDVEQIEQLMRTLAQTGLTECAIESEGFSLRLVREASAAPVQAAPVPVQDAPAPAVRAQGHVISAPIVGTFYAKKAPDAPPYVQVGDRVKAGDVLFIIESMKLMNEVTSEFDGVVAEVLVRDGEAVEYGQPLMRIE